MKYFFAAFFYAFGVFTPPVLVLAFGIDNPVAGILLGLVFGAFGGLVGTVCWLYD